MQLGSLAQNLTISCSNAPDSRAKHETIEISRLLCCLTASAQVNVKCSTHTSIKYIYRLFMYSISGNNRSLLGTPPDIAPPNRQSAVFR